MKSEDYHKHPALSRSDLVALLRSPGAFKWKREHKEKATPAMEFGTAFHALVLEGIDPPVKQAEQIYAMAKNICPLLPQGGRTEVSYFFTYQGVEAKCRPDWIKEDLILDLKTTSSPLEKFHWEALRYRLDIQAAWYMIGTGAKSFRFVVVEKKPPYLAGIFEIQDLSRAYEDIQKAITIYKECEFLGEWPCYSKEVIKI